MDLGIKDRVALVTGASQGIGFGIARALVAEGARVALASRSRERIDAAAADLGGVGFVYDSSDLEAAAGLVADVEATLGPIEILVTNTGGPPPDPDPLGFTREQWEAAHRSLVLAPISLIEQVAPEMRERGFGRVLNVASSAAREPIATLMLSNAHRAGTLGAFKTLARHMAADGVTINTILPGLIATDRLIQTIGSKEMAERAAAEQVPAGRLGTIDELGAVAAFLCSEAASYVTGTALLVDGGITHGI